MFTRYRGKTHTHTSHWHLQWHTRCTDYRQSLRRLRQLEGCYGVRIEWNVVPFTTRALVKRLASSAFFLAIWAAETNFRRIRFSPFASPIPPHCVLPGSAGTHSAYVCLYLPPKSETTSGSIGYSQFNGKRNNGKQRVRHGKEEVRDACLQGVSERALGYGVLLWFTYCRGRRTNRIAQI